MKFLQVFMIGVGLSMDAAAVSVTNGLSECRMNTKKTLSIAALFGFFQGAMPFIGYLAGQVFSDFLSGITPYAALVLLSFIGVKMIVEGAGKNQVPGSICLTRNVLLLQAVATSLDALIVGILFIAMPVTRAVCCFALIGVITFALSAAAVYAGKKFGLLASNRAQVAGGIILIAIGIKIFADYLIAVIL